MLVAQKPNLTGKKLSTPFGTPQPRMSQSGHIVLFKVESYMSWLKIQNMFIVSVILVKKIHQYVHYLLLTVINFVYKPVLLGVQGENSIQETTKTQSCSWNQHVGVKS